MGGLSETEKKSKISKRLEDVYTKYKDICTSRLDLNRKIETELTTDEKKFLEESNINIYFLQEKNNYLNDFSDYLMDKKQKELIEKNEKKEKELTENNAKREKELTEKFQQNILQQQQAIQELQNKFNLDQQKLQKEQSDTIKNLMTQHTQNIEKMRAEAIEQQKRYDEQQKKAERENRELLEKFEKKYKDERDEEKKKQLLEEKKKIEELNKKKDEIQKKFNDSIEKMKKEKSIEIAKSFQLIEENFCLDEITKFDGNKINDLIVNLFKNEKILKNILFNLNVFIDKVKDKIRNVEHLNIILVGPSGVGKSTLINAILELQNQTVTGFGQPQTQNIEFHSSENIPFLRLADSKGIEKNENSGVNAIYESIKGFINSQLQTKDPDQFIHCIWYCWTGARLEDSEIAILKKLSEAYSLETLPIVIVYTNAIDDNQVKQAKDYIATKVGIKKDFIEVLAVEKPVRFGDKIIKIPPMNLDKLKEISIKLAMSAVNSSCYEGLTEEIRTMIKDSIKNLTEELKLKIDYEIKLITSKMTEKSKFEELYENCTHIILDIYYKYIFLNPDIKIQNYKKPEIDINGNKYQISMQSQSLIIDFVIDYFKQSLLSYEKNLNELLSKHTKELCTEIITFQMEYNQQNENLLKIPWTSMELEKIIKKYLHDNLAEKTKLANLKNSFKYISTPIIKKFGEYFITSYNKGMTRPEFIKNAKDVIKVPFNNIEKKIKEYNENTKKKKLEESVQEMAPTPIDVVPNQTANPIPEKTPERTPDDDLDKMDWGN